MDLVSTKEIVVVLITIIVLLFLNMNEKFNHKYKCLESKNKKFVKSIIFIFTGLWLGIILASIINHFLDGKQYLPYHDNTLDIIFDASKYLLLTTLFIFLLFNSKNYNKCNIQLKQKIVFKMTGSFLLGLVLLLPILMARINIKYDISNPKNEIVTIFNKHKSTVRWPACHLSIGSSIQEQSSINLDIGFCDKVEKWQKLKLEYREGYLGYKWISKIQYASKNANKS